MTRFVKSTVGAEAGKGTWSGVVRFQITADDIKATRTITAVDRALGALKNVPPVTITEEEWKSSPSDAYDDLVEWTWLAEKVGMTTAITR
jgi:hypothetical protein